MTVTIPTTVNRQPSGPGYAISGNVPAYQYVIPQIPEMIALGDVSPVVISEQLVINDRLRPDRYIVNSITGLRGSDVRDTRVPHPSAQGEVAYSSFWSGKTITFEGIMESGNIAQLNRLEADLIAVLGPLPAAALGSYYTESIAAQYLSALQSLPELPIRFNWWDQHDGFYDVQSTGFWGCLSGSPLYLAGNGRAIAWSNAGTLSYHNLRSGFIDEVVTAQVSVIPLGGANQIGVIAACTASNDYLQTVVVWDGASTWTFKLQAVQPSGTTTLESQSLTAPAGQTTWWVQQVTIDDTIYSYLYSVDPRSNPSATPVAELSATMLGAMAESLGYLQPGFVGITATSTANWCFLDWRVDSLYPCDFQLGGRLIQSPSMAHLKMKNMTRFQREFQFSVRASDPRILCPTKTKTTIPLTTVTSINLGFTFPLTFPLEFLVPVSEPSGQLLSQTPQQENLVSIVNRGDWVGRPQITFYGGLINPTLTNLTNGQQIILDGTIAANDYVVVDCLLNTLTNSAGNNVFSLFDPSSQWMQLVPGVNILQLTGQSAGGSPEAIVSTQSAWI